MYRFYNIENGAFMFEMLSPIWVKQQERVDFPICADFYEEANGVVGPDGNTFFGILKTDESDESVVPNMDNYKPLLRVVKTDSDGYIMGEINRLKSQVDNVHAYQTEETVLRSDLDTAYTQGVNAI